MMSSITLTEAQRKAISIAPVISAALSVFSGVIVAGYVLVSKERRTVGYHRVILLISIHIILHASALCFGSRPAPAFIQPPIYGAYGTFATCEAQGFIQLFARMASVLYYCSLPLIIFSRMCSNFIETRKTRSIEVAVHLTCTIIPFLIAIVALNRNYINPVKGGAFCGLAVYPDGCLQATSISMSCVRGDHNLEKLVHLSAAVRLFGLAIAFVGLLKILFRHTHGMEHIKTVALVHFFALVLVSAMGLSLYYAWTKRNDAIFPFKLYVTVIGLWPSLGVIHLIAYFFPCFVYPLSKMRMEESYDTNNENIQATASGSLKEEEEEEVLGGSHIKQAKRWSISTIDLAGIRRRTPNVQRWSFSYGESPRPSKVIEAERMQRLRKLNTKKLEVDLQEKTNANKDEHCTIFDGTNPSNRWSTFILPKDLDLDEYEEDEEARYYSDIGHQ